MTKDVTLWKPGFVAGEVGMHGNPLFDRLGSFVAVDDYDNLKRENRRLIKLLRVCYRRVEEGSMPPDADEKVQRVLYPKRYCAVEPEKHE